MLMKNKERYTLTDLDFTISYMTDGCGRKVEKPYYVTVYYQGETVLFREQVSTQLHKWLMRWLEEEK